MTTQKRIIATEWASQLGPNSIIADFYSAKHIVISFNLKQLAITPTGISKVSKKVALPNTLKNSKNTVATMHKYEPNTTSVVFSLIKLNHTKGDQINGLWKIIKKQIKMNFDYTLNKPLIIQRMTTFNFVTNSLCTWVEQSFSDYDHTVSRLVLRTINKKSADNKDYSTLVEVANKLRYKDCAMVGKVHYSCPLI